MTKLSIQIIFCLQLAFFLPKVSAQPSKQEVSGALKAIAFTDVTPLEDTLFKILLGGEDPQSKVVSEGLQSGKRKFTEMEIVQDKEGFIWLSLLSRLYRYDGYSVKYFQPDPFSFSDQPSVSWPNCLFISRNGTLWVGASNSGGINQFNPKSDTFITYLIHSPRYSKRSADEKRIYTLNEDDLGNIWVGTGNGLFLLDPETGSFTSLPIPLTDLSDGEEQPRIQVIKKGREGQMWVGTNKGLYRYQAQKFTHYKHDPSNLSSLNSSNIIKLHVDRSGTLWVGTNKGFHKFLPASESFRRFQKLPNSNRAFNLKEISEDANGLLWVLTNNGLHQFNPQQEVFTGYGYDRKDPIHLSHLDNIFSVFIDKSGLLWINTESRGLRQYFSGKLAFHHYQKVEASDPQPGLRGNMVTSFWEDRLGNLWIGTEMGLNQFNRKARQWNLHSLGSYDNNHVNVLLEDHKGNFWVGTNQGLNKFDRKTGEITLYQYEKEGLAENSYHFVDYICEDKEGYLWIAGQGEIHRFDPATNKFTPVIQKAGPVNFLYMDQNGVLWLGLVKNRPGLYLLNPKIGKLNWYGNITASKNSLSDSLVNNFFEDNKGNFWVGTNQGGLNKIDRKTGTVEVFTTQNGLASNQIRGMQEDSKGRLWISFPTGIARFDPITRTFRNYTASDGFTIRNVSAMHKSLYKNYRGELYFGGLDGFIRFHPDSLVENSYQPPVHITSIQLIDSTLKNVGEHIELSHTERMIGFNFVALNFIHPENNQYAYQLENFDKGWVQAGTRRYTSYTNLSPGTYTFRVKASNNDGVWNQKGTSLIFTIPPPWWQTWWFQIAAFLMVTILGYSMYSYRIKQVRHEEQLKASFEKQLAEVSMMALRAQMNPHFLFNSLNSINHYIIKSKPEEASEYLTKFSRLIRLILTNSKSATVPLAKELEAIRLYIELERIRFTNGFQYSIEVKEGVDVEYFEIPPLLIQPYVENAIWHGLLHKEGIGHLCLQVYLQDEFLYCVITDDGVGRQKAQELKSKSATGHKSMGLQITSDRVALINKLTQKEATVEIIDMEDQAGNPMGTKVVLKIPV